MESARTRSIHDSITRSTLIWLIISLESVGAVFDARAMRPLGADPAALEERHRLRVIALKFYRSAFAVYLGVVLGGLLFN